MTTKELSRKQVIIPITRFNTEIIINSAYQHIANINRCLKKIKSDILANFICKDNNRIIITSNQATFTLDLKIIKKYFKSIKKIVTTLS